MMQACLFDLDGVIVDTAHHHFIAWQRLAQEVLNLPFTAEDNESLKGLSRLESLEFILAEGQRVASAQQKEDWMKLKNAWYLESVESITPDDLLPGTAALLKELKASGVRIALGSASKNAPMILQKLNIADWFDVVIDGNVVKNSKPNPEVFLTGAAQLHVLPSQAVVFEDAVSGVQAAKAGGFFCVGIGQRDVLTQADVVVRNLSEVSLTQLNQWFFQP